eukprot:GHRR01035971.1.p2 GENE.GHRR01035971.1~~GHRR01035971.1.p2  ORF type:complete len:135 (-),score=15.21 GHRR01035971.1:30-434(-)
MRYLVHAGRFAATVAAFCERLNRSDLETLIANFQKRVFSGVRPEVLALTEIPYVKGARARSLYKAGLRTPEAVAASEVDRCVGSTGMQSVCVGSVQLVTKAAILVGWSLADSNAAGCSLLLTCKQVIPAIVSGM